MKKVKTVYLTVAQKVTIEMTIRQAIKEEEKNLKFFQRIGDAGILLEHTLDRITEYRSILETIDKGSYEDVI